MYIKTNIESIEKNISGTACKLIIVTKTKSISILQQIYDLGHKSFGENRVQELVEKHQALPKDIQWHLIGHLQSNKVKYIASFVTLIHTVESYELLKEINKQSRKHNRVINCLLQVYIAKEDTKFGLFEHELFEILKKIENLKNIKIVGLMGMATNTTNGETIRQEFRFLKTIFDKAKLIKTENIAITELSMGMSNDYIIAQEEGSTLIRVGSAIFAS